MATTSPAAFAGAVRALRTAASRDDVERIQAAFAAAAPHDEVALLRDVAALALDRIAASADARQDVLTGVLNRRGFFETACARLVACPGPAAVVAADVDGLKAINDGFGHAAGSRVLRAAAETLRVALPGAVIGRVGGDEFAALVPDRSNTDVLQRALAAALLAQRPDVAPLGLSAGWATGIAVGREDLTALLDMADADLYRLRAATRRAGGARFARAASARRRDRARSTA